MPVHILFDSSGLTVHVGQMQNVPKNGGYRKLHIAVDEQTVDVVGCELTSKRARKVETTFSRCKTILGPAMRVRRLASQYRSGAT